MTDDWLHATQILVTTRPSPHVPHDDTTGLIMRRVHQNNISIPFAQQKKSKKVLRQVTDDSAPHRIHQTYPEKKTKKTKTPKKDIKWLENLLTFKTRISFSSNRLRRRISSGVMPANSSFTSSKMSASFIGNAIFLRRSSKSTTKESSTGKIQTMIKPCNNFFPRKAARKVGAMRERERERERETRKNQNQRTLLL